MSHDLLVQMAYYVHRRRVKVVVIAPCQTIWSNRPLNLSKNVEKRNDAAFSSHLNVSC